MTRNLSFALDEEFMACTLDDIKENIEALVKSRAKKPKAVQTLIWLPHRTVVVEVRAADGGVMGEIERVHAWTEERDQLRARVAELEEALGHILLGAEYHAGRYIVADAVAAKARSVIGPRS